MAFQIRVAATCLLVNRSTGSTPGRLFQISTRRVPGHLAASAYSSCWLLKVSVPSSCFSLGCEEAKIVMLSSTSIVNVIGSFLRVSPIDDIHCSSRRHMQVNSLLAGPVPPPRNTAARHPDLDNFHPATPGGHRD